MAKNKLPDKLSALFSLAEDIIDGLTSTGAAINVKQNLPADVRASLETARAAESDYNTARAARPALTDATRNGDREARLFLTTARDVLKPVLGTPWNQGWTNVGFIGGSLELPKRAADRLELLQQVRQYLHDNPAREVAALNVTAARAGALHTQLSDARAALNQQLTVIAARKVDRNVAVEQLRRRLRGTIAELSQLLSATDPTWHTFGLVPPGAAQTPDVPDGLVLTPGAAGAGIVYLDWDDAPRADRYRIWRQLPAEADPVAVASVTESDATLSGQPLGQLLRLFISAVNDAGETLRSEPVAITLA